MPACTLSAGSLGIGATLVISWRSLILRSHRGRQPRTLLLALSLFVVSGFASTPATTQASEISVRTVQMPFDPDSVSDSDFLRHLLLTHGLALEGDDKPSIGVARYQQLIASIQHKHTRSNPLIKDVSEQFSLSLLKGAVDPARTLSNEVHDVPKQRILWWISDAQLPSSAVVDAEISQAGTSKNTARAIEPPVGSAHGAAEPAPESIAKETANPVTERISAAPLNPVLPPLSIDTQASEDSAPSAPMIGMHPDSRVDTAPDSKEKDESTDLRKPRITVNDDIPEGFEALSGPQFMFVDLFFNDTLIGSSGITITDGTITFEDPEEVARQLGSRVTDPALEQRLAEPLPANGHLACYATNDPEGCGQIDADPLALIYNAVLLRLDIFVSPELQRAGLSEQAQFLPDPTNKGSAIVSVHGIASELSGSPTRMDLTVGTILSYGRGLLSTDIHYNTQTENNSVNTFNLTHHFNDYELNAGTYGYSVGGALNDINLIGVGFSTSFNTRVDLEQAFSSQLPVYLPRRSVVQILINDRIHSGASYAAGNQLLDTSALPDGTYEVEIVINDASGQPRRERRLFTKSALIPPAGRWLLSATAGAIRNSIVETLLPEASNTNAAGVSAARRIGDQSAYRLGVLQYDETTIAQSEFLYLGPRWSFNVALSAGEQSLKAAGIQSTLRLNDHHISLNATHFSSSVITVADSPSADFFAPNNSRLDLSYQRTLPWLTYGASIGVKRENTGPSMDDATGFNTGADLIGASLATGSADNESDTKTFSLFAQRPVLRTRHQRGFLGFRYQQDDQHSHAQLSLDLYFGRGSWRAGTSAALINSSDQGTQWETRASAGWRSDNPTLGSVAADAYVNKTSDLQSYGLSTELRHAWFRASASTDFSRYATESTTQNSIASFSAHAGFDSDGGGLGGGDISGAGLIVDVSGEPAGEVFDVLVDNVRVDEARIGSPQFIGLQAFDQYTVKLRPRSVLGNGIGDTSHTLTLFPGNIGRLSITARRQALLIAMVADEYGNAIDNAVVTTSTNTLLIDDSGLLQAEVHQGEILEVRRRDRSICHITVHIAVMEDVVVPDEPIICVSQTVGAALPSDSDASPED